MLSAGFGGRGVLLVLVPAADLASEGYDACGCDASRRNHHSKHLASLLSFCGPVDAGTVAGRTALYQPGGG